MLKKVLKILRNTAIFLVIFGVIFSNIPFYALTDALDAYVKARNIVDKAWHLSQDSNIVDKFTSYRNLIEKIKVYEARAATIEFVGGASASGINAAYNMSLTALTGGIASAPAQGDIVIVINMIANTTNGNPGVGTAGYIEVADLYRGDTYDTNLSTNYKVMSASPDTTASCNPSSGSSIASDCVAMVFRGVDTTMPMDVAFTSAISPNSEDVNCPAITPVTSGAVVVCTGGAAGASVDTTPTAPTGYSGSTYVQTDPGSAGAAVASYKNWTSGAEDPAAYVMDLGTASANSWAAITLALRPANDPPTLTVSQPDGVGDTVTVGDLYNITYDLADSDNVVTAAMYYDTDYLPEINPDANTVGLWHLNETTGTNAPDTSGNNNNGTLGASPATPTWAPGKISNALSFDGVDDYVDIGNAINPSGVTSYTIEAWVKSTAGAVSDAIAGWYDGTNGIFMQSKTSGQGLLVLAGNGNSYGQVDVNTSADWTHAVLVYDGSLSGNINRLKLYVNGTLQTLAFGVGTVPASIPVLTSTNLKIGDVGALNRKWAGSIDEVAIWNTALDAATIANHAALLNDTAITGACAAAAEGTGVTCSWDTTGMTPGTYYVYGITNDGVNPQVSDYSPGVITINAAGSDATSYTNTETALDFANCGTTGCGGRIGQQITIAGTNFGTPANKDVCTSGATNGCVRIANYTVPAANISSWIATQIVFTIPSGITVYGGSGTTCGGADGNGICVTQNGNDDPSGALEFWVFPDITSTTPAVSTGAKEGDSVTISGNRFGSAGGTLVFQNCAGGDVDATPTGGNWTDTSLTVTVPSGIADDDDSCDIKITRAAGTGSKTDILAGFIILPTIVSITNCDKSGFPSGSYAREYDAGDSACLNNLTDGAIVINGNHFGSSGSVTILSQTASQAAVTGFCGGSAYTATCVAVQAPTTIGDGAGGAGDYVGNVVLTRSGKSDTLSGFRILPRITGFTPGNGEIGASVTVNGNHFCQNAGSCPSSFDTNNKVTFYNGVEAATFTSWNNTAMATQVPAGAATGDVVLKSNTYDSNGKSFTVNVPTPTDPANMKQARNSGITNLIATYSGDQVNGIASSTPIYFAADTSSGITGGTMYLQTEMRLTGNNFASSTCSAANYCFEGPGFPYSGGTITATSSTTTADGFYHWHARIRYDKLGSDYFSAWTPYGANTDPDGIDVKIDTAAPILSTFSEDTSVSNQAIVEWNTDEFATTQLEYGTDSGLSGSTLTAITDTPAGTNGKITGHSVTFSNLNCGTTYYYRAHSRDAGNIEGTSSILDLITAACPSQPAKTASFHIAGATGSVTNGSPLSQSFFVSIPENATTTKSAFVEVAGVYSSGASSKDIGINFNSQGERVYQVPASTISYFKFIYPVNTVNPSNTLYVTPQTNTTVYITSARLIVTYSYTP